jgi:hypothetical protein
MSPSLLPNKGDRGPLFQLSPLVQGNRKDIVVRMGTQQPGSAYALATEFSLTSLGINLNLLGQWSGGGLVLWQHLTQTGRDHHAKIVYGGYLMPLGHRATLVQITDRVIYQDPVSPSTHANAYLQYHVYIKVNQHVKTYPAYGQPYGLNAWPFPKVEIITKRTPDLDPWVSAYPPTLSPLSNPPPQPSEYPQAFLPQTLGEYVKFDIKLTDASGQIIQTKVPLGFVFSTDINIGAKLNQYLSSDMKSTIDNYNLLGAAGSSNQDAVTAPIPGTVIRYAPPVSHNGKQKPGGTSHPTLAILLGAASSTKIPTASGTPDQTVATYPSPASTANLTAQDQPCFYPTILTSYVRVPAAEQLGRKKLEDGSGPGGVAIFMLGKYVSEGFNTPKTGPVLTDPQGFIDPSTSSNPGSVFAGLLDPPDLNFPSDAIGGLANPNLGVSGLSGAAGAIGGLLSGGSGYADLGKANPLDYFAGILTQKFLGGLTLSDILGEFLSGGDDMGIPEIVKNIAQDGTVTISYTLKAKLSSFAGIFNPYNSDAMFTLTATVTVSLSGKVTLAVDGSVDGFKMDILGDPNAIIEIPFGSDSEKGATFSGGTGKKTDIKVNVGQPTFQGALAFVNTLEDFLKDIGGSGVSIDVGPTQIQASISLDLPSVGCGVFNLENMALSAQVTIPFLGDPATAQFSFCSQEKPFTLTVMCFGGGGYVTVCVGLTSVQSLTASFDFEGELGLDLGVASGSVSAMAGITFTYTNGQGATLTGFVKITGEVEVLGILSVTLELDLTLTYATATNQATGTATMTISVSLCMFSISVPITVSKTFNGGKDSPHAISRHAQPRTPPTFDYTNQSECTFAKQMDKDEWMDYCNAFAA